MNFLYCSIIGYGFGCIQAAYLLSRLFLKEDIRTKGNGNAGASNMTVAYGKTLGALVAIIDILKGTGALLLVKHIFPSVENINTLLYMTGFFVILGHNFPFYMGFKGGKGTASLIGMIFGINLGLGVFGVIILIAATFISDYIVIGTFSLLISFVIMTYFMNYGFVPLVFSLLIALLSVYKHRENIVKMINREEKSVRATLLKKKAGKDHE
jgi:glycerol-3-phosphate acyltransferase PlsY